MKVIDDQNMQKIPKLVTSKTLFKNDFQEVKLDIIALDGKQWEQVYFIKPNKDGVGILPADETGIYLVNQYRHANRSFMWQIPLGMINKGDTALETARKELLEEAGISAKELIQIGSLIAEPGMSNQEEFIFLATGLEMRQQHPEDSEVGMQVKHFTFDEIEKMVREGEIKCGFTLSALYLLKNNYKK